MFNLTEFTSLSKGNRAVKTYTSNAVAIRTKNEKQQSEK